MVLGSVTGEQKGDCVDIHECPCRVALEATDQRAKVGRDQRHRRLIACLEVIPALARDRTQVLEIELLPHHLQASVDEGFLGRAAVHGEVTAVLDRIEDPAAERMFFQRPDRADRKHRRRLAVAEANRVPIQGVEAPGDRLLAQERQGQRDDHGGTRPRADGPEPYRPRERASHSGCGLERDGERRDGEEANKPHAHRRQHSEEPNHGQVEE